MKRNGYPYLTDTSMDDGCSIWPACGCIDERCDGEPVRSSTAVRVVLHVLCWGAGMAGIAALGMAVLAATNAKAHEAPSGMKYDAVCCNGNTATGDCQPIPTTSVRSIAGGFQITLRPGDHHMVTRVHVFQVSQAAARVSTDGQYHACLYPNEDNLMCFYAPPMSY